MASSFKDVGVFNEQRAIDVAGKQIQDMPTKTLIARVVSENPEGLTFNEITVALVQVRPNYRSDILVALDELMKEEVLCKEAYVWKTTAGFQARVDSISKSVHGKSLNQLQGINLQVVREYIEEWVIFDHVGMQSYPDNWTSQYRVGHHVFSELSRIAPTEAIDNVQLFKRVADAFKDGRPEYDADLATMIGITLNAFERSRVVQTTADNDNVYSLTGMAREAMEEIKGRRKVVTETFQSAFTVLGREFTPTQVYSMVQMLTHWVNPNLDLNDCSITLYGIVFTKKLAADVLSAMAENILFERLLHDLGYQKPPAV